ncbi:MAG TPA: dihydropteroate synthase [Thermoanaerobaculaceae bacterium]|nr:dihydropteroate synthase [Thermoanaerobaculaceae bacterium]HPS76884.1 dihydropteroate synthase [Thermoanaerobaculaceae bacterium]
MIDWRVDALWERRRPAVMAILNVTPDSFSDGGSFLDPEAAIGQAEALLAQGADIIDVGGESTRPGASPVDTQEEERRVVPVIKTLVSRHPDLLLSVDTSKPAVAVAALAAGARIVNDVTASPEMMPLVAGHGAVLVLMHMRGTPHTMQVDTRYTDVVAEVVEFLATRASQARASGISDQHIWLDPGIGFGKDLEGNLRLLAHLPDLAALGHPVVVGASRKSFVGALSGAAVNDRLAGSLAALTPLARLPRVIARVHDVGATVQFLGVQAALWEAA